MKPTSIKYKILEFLSTRNHSSGLVIEDWLKRERYVKGDTISRRLRELCEDKHIEEVSEQLHLPYVEYAITDTGRNIVGPIVSSYRPAFLQAKKQEKLL